MKTTFLSVLLLLASLTLLVPVGPITALADELVITPGVNVRETYDDNIFFDDVSDFETRVSPSLILDYNTVRTKASLSAIFDVLRYVEKTDYDRENQTYGLKIRHRLAPVVDLSLDAGFTRDSTFEEVLRESGIRAEKSVRDTHSFQPGLSWTIDERNSLRTSYEYSHTNYHSDDYDDTVLHGGQLVFSHSLEKDVTSLFLSLQGQSVAYENQGRGDDYQRVYYALVGLEYRPNPAWTVTLAPGVGLTETDFTASGLEESSSWTFLGNAEVKWRSNRFEWTLSGSRTLEESLYGENITKDTVRGSLYFWASERLTAVCSAWYHNSETEGIREDYDIQSYAVNPRLSYLVTRDARLALGFEHTSVHDRRAEDDWEHRNQVYMELSVGFPMKF